MEEKPFQAHTRDTIEEWFPSKHTMMCKVYSVALQAAKFYRMMVVENIRCLDAAKSIKFTKGCLARAKKYEQNMYMEDNYYVNSNVEFLEDNVDPFPHFSGTCSISGAAANVAMDAARKDLTYTSNLDLFRIVAQASEFCCQHKKLIVIKQEVTSVCEETGKLVSTLKCNNCKSCALACGVSGNADWLAVCSKMSRVITECYPVLYNMDAPEWCPERT